MRLNQLQLGLLVRDEYSAVSKAKFMAGDFKSRTGNIVGTAAQVSRVWKGPCDDMCIVLHRELLTSVASLPHRRCDVTVAQLGNQEKRTHAAGVGAGDISAAGPRLAALELQAVFRREPQG